MQPARKRPANASLRALTRWRSDRLLRLLFGQRQGLAVLMVEDTLYLVTPYPNNLIATDLTKPGGALKWKVEPRPAATAQGTACCDTVNRGPTYSDGTIYFNTIDAHTLAVDAETGRVKWKAKVGDFEKGETMTMAPFVVRDRVFVGNSGAEFGARGWITALNTSDGSIAWRAYTTGPDRDVLIDPPPSSRSTRNIAARTWA